MVLLLTLQSFLQQADIAGIDLDKFRLVSKPRCKEFTFLPGKKRATN
jgi:hypothetical protein